jgi:membrane protein
VVGSFLLRIYLTSTVEGPTIYGSLAAPIAVLLWIGISAFAVLVGAAVNAAIDRVWPSLATAAARAANDRVRAVQAAELLARAQAENAEADWDDIDEGDTPYMPSEFPERWSRFLPPDDVKSRLRQPSRDKETTKDTSKDADRRGKGSPKSRS